MFENLINIIPIKNRFPTKVIILYGYSGHNTAILSAVHNLSTTCFGQCFCGHHQVGYNLSEKLYRYDITQNNY